MALSWEREGEGHVSSGGECLQSDVGYLISGGLFVLNRLVVAGWGWEGREREEGGGRWWRRQGDL